MITIKNYFQKVAGVAFDSAPDAIFEGHTFVTKLSKNGQDWTAYEQSDYIKQTVDIYFEKLEEFLKPGKLIQLPVKKLVKPKRKGKSNNPVVSVKKVVEGKKPLAVSVKKSAELADIEKFLRMDKRELSYGSILILSRTISKRLKESNYKSHLGLLDDISKRLKKLVTTLENDGVKKFKVNIDLDLQDRCTKAIESATVVMRTDYLAGVSHDKFGPIFNQFSERPEKAIKHLLKVKTGVCTNVFYRNDVGFIDLPYGENNSRNVGFGLKHIYEKHGDEIRGLGFNVSDFLTVCINQGQLRVVKKKNRILLQSNMFRVVLDKYKEKAFLLSAFDLSKKALKGINGTILGIDFTKRPLYAKTNAKVELNVKKKSPLQKKSIKPLDGIDFAIEAKANRLPVTSKSVKPVNQNKTGLCDAKPDALFKPITHIETKETFMLKDDVGKFLGNLERYQLSMTLEGDQGAGKTQFSFQLANAFAEAGYDVGFFSLEVGANSDIIKRNRDKYLSPIGLKKVLIAGEAPRGIETIREYAKRFGVVIIDSFTKLNCDSREFDKLRKEFPETIWIVIFQRTSGGQIRGGTQPLFDAGINIEVVKADESFVNNYAVATKNRYGMTGIRFNISQSKIIE